MTHPTHPVLIIQGFLAPTLTNLILKRRLQRAGFLAEDVPIEGLNAGDIRESARLVEMSVNAMLARTAAGKVDLIGISMGGLIGLQYLRKLSGDKYVRRFVAIGTPFNGIGLARVMQAATLGRAPGAEQMVPGSEFLKELHDHDWQHEAEIYSLHTDADAFVPEHSAALRDAILVKSPHGFWPAGHYTPLILKEDFFIVRDLLLKP
jgi:triacylglycerol lipase